MTRLQRLGVIGLIVAMSGSVALPILLRGAGPGRPAATAPGARTAEQILGEMEEINKELVEVMPNLPQIGNAEFRAKAGPKAAPLLAKLVAGWKELNSVMTDAELKEDTRVKRYLFMTFAATMGDAESLKTLEADALKSDANGVSAKAGLALTHWLKASDNAAAQAAAVQEMAKVAKENGKSQEVADMLGFMANVGAANNDLTKQVVEVVRMNVQVDGVKKLLAELDGAQRQREMLGKPIAFEGRTSTGGKFELSQYKGKVVLIDFWATWCVPCILELPDVKKLYQEYHDRGFEVVGVAWDGEDKVLNDFIKEKELPWVQLRETSQTELENMHPLSPKLGVPGVPWMYLVDRKGVLRYVDARADLEKKVAELMNEKAE